MDQSKNKLLPLDGLRGIAAFTVVLHHLKLSFFATGLATLGNNSTLPFRLVGKLLRIGMHLFMNGTFAVWIFWVLSGFVLSLQFFQRKAGSPSGRAVDYLINAAFRRYPRLMLPVLASVLFAWALFAAGWMHNHEAAQALVPEGSSGWLSMWYNFLPNFFMAFKSGTWDTFFNFNLLSSYNNVLWSMGRELSGSFLLFGLLYVSTFLRDRFILYAFAAALLLLTNKLWVTTFLGGIILCDLFVNHRLFFPAAVEKPSRLVASFAENVWLAAAAWLCLIIASSNAGENLALVSLLAIACVGLTLVSKPTQRMLSGPIPAFLGKISFGLYLVHVPIILSLSCWAYIQLEAHWGHYLTASLVSLVTIAISIVAGWLFHRWIDEPSMKFSRWLAGKILRPPERARS